MWIQRFLNYGREFRYKSRVLPGWEEPEKEAKMCVCVLYKDKWNITQP